MKRLWEKAVSREKQQKNNHCKVLLTIGQIGFLVLSLCTCIGMNNHSHMPTKPVKCTQNLEIIL